MEIAACPELVEGNPLSIAFWERGWYKLGKYIEKGDLKMEIMLWLTEKVHWIGFGFPPDSFLPRWFYLASYVPWVLTPCFIFWYVIVDVRDTVRKER